MKAAGALGCGWHANSMKTHCPHGHPYVGQNLRYERGGGRRCRACRRKEALDRYHRDHAAEVAARSAVIAGV